MDCIIVAICFFFFQMHKYNLLPLYGEIIERIFHCLCNVLYAHWHASVPAPFQVSIGILSKSSVWKWAGSKYVSFKDAPTHNILVIQVFQCAYRLHWCMGNKTQKRWENTECEKTLLKSRGSQLILHRDLTPVHLCQCCPVEKTAVMDIFVKKSEKHSNKTSKEMFNSSILLYIYF